VTDSERDQTSRPLEWSPPPVAAPNLAGHVAAVTGGAGTIGRAVVGSLVDVGAQVVIGDIDLDAAEAAAARIGDPGRAIAHQVDVREPSSAGGFVARAVTEFGRLDILVNNAGIIHVDPLLEIPPHVWRNVFAVNVEGALYCLQAAARIMANQDVRTATNCRGKIVNVSSQGAEFALPTSAAYGASKRALNYLTETAAADLTELAISVTGVYPGMVYEGMWRSVNLERSRIRAQDFEQKIQEDLADTPSGRFQDPVELARIIVFAVAYRGNGLSGKTIWSEPHVA
jgi:glucose 1-dehydrogenase